MSNKMKKFKSYYVGGTHILIYRRFRICNPHSNEWVAFKENVDLPKLFKGNNKASIVAQINKYWKGR